MKIKNLQIDNINKVSWFEYYLDITGDEKEVIDGYGTKEELSDICQIHADISIDSNKLGKVEIAYFEGMGDFLEVGFTECTDDFKQVLEKAGAVDLDIDGIGFEDTELEKYGYTLDKDAFLEGDEEKILTTIGNFVNDILENKDNNKGDNSMKNEKLITEAPDQYGLPTDDEIEAEERAEFEKRLADRKAQRDADFKKKDDERISKEKAEQRKAELKAKADEILKELGSNPSFEDAFDKLVPSSGACESVGAELIRAVNRLEYRWLNDGDRFFAGYGLETCGSPAAFISDNVEEYGKPSKDDIDMIISDAAENNLNDDDYTNFLDTLKERIIKLVFEEHPELLGEPLGEKDIHSWTDGEEYWDDYIPRDYDFTFTVSDKVQEYLDRGDISSWNVIQEINSWMDSTSITEGLECDTPWGYSDSEYTISNLTEEQYEELDSWDSDSLWSDFEDELESEFGVIADVSDLEDQCYDKLISLKDEFSGKGYDIDISGVGVDHNDGNTYICSFDLEVNGQSLGNVEFEFESDEDGDVSTQSFQMDAEANIEDAIETQYEEPEETDESLKESVNEDSNFKFNKGDKAYTTFASFASGNKHLYEPVTIDDRWNDEKWGNEYSFTHKNGDKCSKCPEKLLLTKDELDKEIAKGSLVVEGDLSEAYNNEEMKEFVELCNKLGFTKLVDIDKFAKEHGNVKDQELLQAMRDAVNSTNESLKEEFTTIEDAFKSVNGNKKVFDKEGYFIDDTYEKYAQKVADKFFNGNIDELDKICEEEHCFKESLKEDYNYDEDAFYQAYNNGDIYCYIVKDDDDDDFMIVDDYEEIQKIQKLLSPNFESKDKYDTSVLDNFMSWGFSDSYSSCDYCGKLIGTEPDSKHWTPDFFVSDNGLICGDCVRKDPSEYLQSLANNPDSANTILSESELEDAGFVKLDGDYQNGWYDRQDDPRSILDDLLIRFPDGVFIFNITAQAQFATNFDVWGEEGTFDEYDDYEDEETDESLKEEVEKVFTDEEIKELTKDIYDTLEDNGIYPENAYIWNYTTYAQLQVTISGDWKHDHLFGEHLIEDVVKSKGYKITNTEEVAVDETGADYGTSIHYFYLER